MPARVGMSVGAVRCLAEAWVWPEVLALRGSGHIREGKALLITGSFAFVLHNETERFTFNLKLI